MFNARYKKEAIAACERAAAEHQAKYNETIDSVETLHRHKETAVGILKDVDTYIHSLSNKPESLDTMMAEITVRRIAFEEEISDLKDESKKITKTSIGIAATGVAAGVGAAAIRSSRNMAIATTFGTASTGAAIATLSGAAGGTLAAVGGGALVGGGMAAGGTALAMAGPAGWAIGGAVLLGSALMANSKNKKLAEKAEAQTKEIKKETDSLKRLDTKVKAEIIAVIPLNTGIQKSLQNMMAIEHRDYGLFTEDQKDMLIQLMNSAESLSKRIGIKIT